MPEEQVVDPEAVRRRKMPHPAAISEPMVAEVEHLPSWEKAH